jgi:dsDNA-binding SOS-regulon protein
MAALAPTSMNFSLGDAASSTSSTFAGIFGSPWLWIGVLVALLIFFVVKAILPRADTRPIKQGFYGGPINGTSEIACGRMSSEAEALIAMFNNRPLDVGEEGSQDLHDLKAVLSKMLCMKSDLMAPQRTITAVKELGFATHMDIQPVADLTARCFSFTIPERDLSIQFGKWRDFGLDMVKRLCTAAVFTEEEANKAEHLFIAAWKDAMSVAFTMCLKTPTQEKQSPHDAAPHVPEELQELRPYDGYY